MHYDNFLDTKGLLCPEPVMLLHVAIRKAISGQIVKVEATDPSTERDFAKFCQFLGHTLLAVAEEDGVFQYWIQKK
jgi:tRNA 2-thiouridine synthesizing protein A